MPEDNRQQSVFFCAQNTRKTSYVEMKHKKERGIYMTFEEILKQHQKEYGMMVCEPPAYLLEKQQGEYTIHDLAQISEELRVELIDGHLIYLEAPVSNHQRVAVGLTTALVNYIDDNNGDCIVYTAPFDVQLRADDIKNVFQPDVLVVCDQTKDNGKHIVGAPDLVIEILSPSTQSKDKEIKYRKYKEAGVREYWIVDLKNMRVIVYDFEHIYKIAIYGFGAEIPVGIFGGKCVIDFSKIADKLLDE